MADNKKYYYLKLKAGFFDSDEMILLESMPDGYLYSNILLKLYLKSLKFEGKLMVNEKIPYNAEILATVTRHKVGVVEKALEIFRELGLIDVLDNGAIYMLDIQNFIGRSSTEADRKREYRKEIDIQKIKLIGQMSGQMSANCPDKSIPEIEIEKEIEIKIYSPVIDYLNSKCNTSYKSSSKKTKSLIDARVHEGFVLEDFKKVIDIKAAEWNDTDMAKYLRPETLFGTKFESYLNQKTVEKPKQQPKKYNKFNDNMIKNDDIDFNDIEDKLRDKYTPDISELEERMKERWGE